MLLNIRHGWYLFEKHVVTKTRKILQHVMVWVRPSWSYPAPASSRYKDFEWTSEVRKVCLGDDSETGETAGNASRGSPSLFLEQLHAIVENDSMWKDPSLESHVSHYYIPLTMVSSIRNITDILCACSSTHPPHLWKRNLTNRTYLMITSSVLGTNTGLMLFHSSFKHLVRYWRTKWSRTTIWSLWYVVARNMWSITRDSPQTIN